MNLSHESYQLLRPWVPVLIWVGRSINQFSSLALFPTRWGEVLTETQTLFFFFAASHGWGWAVLSERGGGGGVFIGGCFDDCIFFSPFISFHDSSSI